MRFGMVGGLILACPAWMYASCGSAACTLDTRSEELGATHQLIADISYQYINQDQPRIGNRSAAVGELPNPHHDEIATINRQVTGRFGYTLSDRWTVGLALPFLSRTHSHLSNEAAPPEYQEWRFAGLGDLAVEVRYLIWAPSAVDAARVTVSAEGKFPTGATTARNTEGELAEPTLQPGTGSYDAIGGLAYWSPLAAVPMLAGGQGRLRMFGSAKYRINTAGIDGYRMGNEVLVSQGASYPLLSRLDLLAQLDCRFKAKDHRGDTDEDTDFTGGDFLWASPGLRLHLTNNFSFYGYLQLPVYQRVNNEQIMAARQALVGVTYTFSNVGGR
jgi:hypothetical protein